MAASTEEDFPNEARLMTTCGHLYVSIAIESLSTTIMAGIFGYLLLLITNKGRVQNPGKALCTFLKSNLRNFYTDVRNEVVNWKEMPNLPLEKRFAFCRKVNQAICLFQIFIAVLTVERWLHINNVNGFRYLGYSMTCPPMQAELVVLVAPVVPFYKSNIVVTYFLTMLMLWFGYAASIVSGDMYEGSWVSFTTTWDMTDLQPNYKFWFVLASGAVQCFLTFVQIPWLAFLYCFHGGPAAGLPPRRYLTLLLVVAITWTAFPFWWALSYEGMSIVTDTKMNALGFCVLNIVSKGSFTLLMLSMVKAHKREQQLKECEQNGSQPANIAELDLFNPEASMEVQPRRKERRTETWVVSMLRKYDQEGKSLDWTSLEPTYRAYLVGLSITPKSWHEMGVEKRNSLQTGFEAHLDLLRSDDLVSQCSTAEISTRRSSLTPAEVCTPPSSAEIHLGQSVTTRQGLAGRVVKVTPDELHLQPLGTKKREVISRGDVTVLKIGISGTKELFKADGQAGLQPCCACSVDGLTDSEVITGWGTKSRGLPASWEGMELQLLGYAPGDTLTFQIYVRDLQSGSESLLADAHVGSGEMAGGAYYGELALQGEDEGDALGSVTVSIVALNLPECKGRESSEACAFEF